MGVSGGTTSSPVFSNHFIDNVRGAVSDQLNLTKKQRKKKTHGDGVPKEKIDRVIDTVVYRFTTYYRKKLLKEREDAFYDRGVDMNERVIVFD
jgi:hypothetical protein